MKKSLLIAVSACSCALIANADVATVYTYNTDEGMLHSGALNRVSANGRWAVGADVQDKSGSLIIDTNNPNEFTHVTDGAIFDVTNEGICVGSLFDNRGTEEYPVYYLYAATYENGQWYLLPSPPAQSAQSYARAVSADGKYIAGMAFCKDETNEISGKYYPVLWTYNEEILDYEVHAFTELDLPANMGMDVNDVSEDGRVIAGTLRTYAGSFIPALVVDGELKIWNKLEVKLGYIYYDDKILTDKDGNPLLTEYGYVDGLCDGYDLESWFNGGFSYINGDYVYGHRSKVDELDLETGRGTTSHYRSVYRISTDEFIDQPSDKLYSCGFGTEKMFSYTVDTSYNYAVTILQDGNEKKIEDVYTLDGDRMPAVVYGTNDKGNILACSTVWFNDAIGEFCEAPCLVIVEDGAGVDNVIADTAETLADAPVYDLQGRRILPSRADINNLPSGIYISAGKKLVVR